MRYERKRKPWAPRASDRWTPAEDAEILHRREVRGETKAQIAEAKGRTWRGVKNRLEKLRAERRRLRKTA